MSEALTVRVAETDDLAAAHAVRRAVFIDEQGVPAALEIDAADEVATHVVAERGEQIVATGRLFASGVVGQVGRMAVRASERGTGVGARLLRRLEIEARRLGLHRVELHAQLNAVGFYDRQGYRPQGEGFIEAGIEHQLMFKDLPVRRQVRDGDSTELIELITAAFDEYPGCVMDVDGEEPWLRQPATAYQHGGGTMWVYCLSSPQGPVVACGGIKPSGPGRFELKNLYVAARARRQGLAEELTELVQSEAAALGGTVVHLWSDTRFTDAHRLYRRLGYAQLPETRELFDKSETTEFHFSRDLGTLG